MPRKQKDTSRVYRLRNVHVDDLYYSMSHGSGNQQTPVFNARGKEFKSLADAEDFLVYYNLDKVRAPKDRRHHWPRLEIVPFVLIMEHSIADETPNLEKDLAFLNSIGGHYSTMKFALTLIKERVDFRYIFTAVGNHEIKPGDAYVRVRRNSLSTQYTWQGSKRKVMGKGETLVAVSDVEDANLVYLKLKLCDDLVGIWDRKAKKRIFGED